MPGRASAFEILELEPGANAAAIEQAYRRLIKQYHPDRQGGDSTRAAEINRAYRELRGGKAGSDPLQFNEEPGASRKRVRWPVAALIGGAIATLIIVAGPSVPLTPRLWAQRAHLALPRRMAPADPDPMAATLHLDSIDEAVREAVRLYRTKDEMSLASASRECQRRFREQPGTALLDHCAAFDDAVVGLEDRDPIRDGGPFAPLAVTGRQWSAASALSDDYLAIDGRLDQVRLRVELELAPQVPPVAPAGANSD